MNKFLKQSKITKAVIPAAGLGTRFLPATKAIPKEMLPIINVPTIQYIVEEAVKSGIKEILIIVSQTKNAIMDHFDYAYELENRLKNNNKNDQCDEIRKIADLAKIQFIRQKEPLGLGHAIKCARSFVNNEPFAVLLGDDIIATNNDQKPALLQCIEAFEKTHTSIVGVQKVDKSEVHKYGIVDPVTEQNLYGNKITKLKNMIEKPDVVHAPSNYAILGRYVLTNEIFNALETIQSDKYGEIQLTDGIKKLMEQEDVYACEFDGMRYDIGSKLGYVKATIDFSLSDSNIGKEVRKYILSTCKRMEK